MLGQIIEFQQHLLSKLNSCTALSEGCQESIGVVNHRLRPKTDLDLPDNPIEIHKVNDHIIEVVTHLTFYLDNINILHGLQLLIRLDQMLWLFHIQGGTYHISNSEYT